MPCRSAAVLALFALPLLLAPGCRMNRFIASQMAANIQDEMTGFEREANVRHAREAGPALLKMLDGFLVSAPDNPDLLLHGTRMNTTFAFALIEDEDEAWARDLYTKARAYGLRLLGRRPGFTAALAHGGGELDAALASFQKADLPALFWTSYAWGSRINLDRKSPDSVADLPAVQTLMARVLELDPAYYHAAPHLFFGVTLGARSKAMGGDLPASRQHFEAAVDLTHGRYLLARVLFARFYCVQAQDRTLFVKLLNEVKQAPPDLDPDQALANAIAKRRAEKLLKQVDDLILPEVPEEPAK